LNRITDITESEERILLEEDQAKARSSSSQDEIKTKPKTTEEYMSICIDFIESLKSGTAPWMLQRLNHTYGSMPLNDPCAFSYWMVMVS